MRHSSTKSNIMVVDVALTFEEVYKKPYFATAYGEEIKKANVLIIPSENIREGLEPVFPELTSDFLRFLRKNAKENMKVDIAVDDEHFHKLVLYSPSVALATLLIREEVLEDTTKLVSGFLKAVAKKNNRPLDELDAFVNIIVEGEDLCRKIMFTGRVSELDQAFLDAVKQGFSGGNDER